MYPSERSGRISVLVLAALITTGAVAKEPGTMTGHHDFRSSIPDGCQFGAHDGTQNPADYMQTFANELGVTGQQLQDLQILAADYAERLRDLAKLMGDSAKKLAGTKPGDPNYWPLAQEVSASAASSSAETVILISEMREKFSAVLTAEQRAELKRRIEERMAQCKPQVEAEAPAG